MSVLGPGTRVWIGWCPDDRATEDARSARCTLGTVTAGPLLRGQSVYGRVLSQPGWMVRPDGYGYDLFCAKHLLTPLDGGEPERVEEEREVETT